MLPHALRIGAGHIDGLARFIALAIKHGRGDGAGCGDKALGLLGIPVPLPQPARQGAHVLVRTAGKTAHEVGHNVLFAPCGAALAHKAVQKDLKNIQRGLAHELQHRRRTVFGRNLELPAGEFAGVGRKGIGIAQCKVGAHTAGHAGLFYFWQCSNLTQ